MKLSKKKNLLIKLFIIVLVFVPLVFFMNQEVSYRSNAIFFKTAPDSISKVAKNMMLENPNSIVTAIGKSKNYIDILIPEAHAKVFYKKYKTNKTVAIIWQTGTKKFPPSENKKSKKMQVSIYFSPGFPTESSLASDIVKKNHGSIKRTIKGILVTEVDMNRAEKFLFNVIENNAVESVKIEYNNPPASPYLF